MSSSPTRRRSGSATAHVLCGITLRALGMHHLIATALGLLLGVILPLPRVSAQSADIPPTTQPAVTTTQPAAPATSTQPFAAPTAPQITAGGAPFLDPEDEILVPDSISTSDIEMSGKYCRQWRHEDGTLFLVYNGDFRLLIGKRTMRAEDAVVWIVPERIGVEQRKAYNLTVYLSDNAEVQEASGTFTQDTVLLVSNIRTFGRIVKKQDAHAPESAEDSEFYKRAVEDRRRIEEALLRTDTEAPAAQISRAADADAARIRRAPRPVRYRVAGIEPARTADGETVLVMAGRVQFMQAGSTEAATLEISADRAVVFPVPGRASSFLDRLDTSEGGTKPKRAPSSKPAAGGAPDAPANADTDQRGKKDAVEKPDQFIRAVYLEGDVTLSMGNRFVRAERLYYDFERDRALILDAVFRAEMPDRGVPLYVRAAEFRQLSANEYAATNAVVTTSEFYTPHYHVGAERVLIQDKSQRDASGNTIGGVRGSYEMRNTTFNVENSPFLWWPYSQGDFSGTETALRGFRTSYGDRRGVQIETEWDLYTLAGVQKPPGHDARMHLDYYSKRGPGVGLDYDYAGQDNYGLLRTYYLHDYGEDNLGPLRRSEEKPADENRGRTLWRHRHFLPNDWELTFEISYISDPNFLEEWRKSEFQEGKEQETLIHLKRARGNEAITFLANWRILDFTTQTEHLPELTYRRIGDTYLDPLVLYTEGRVGGVRYRPDDRRFLDEYRFDNLKSTDATARADGRQEAELPLKLGGVNIIPFGTVRGSYWDGQPRDGGGLWRGFAVYGVRASTMFSRVFSDVQNELLDVNGIRHIIKPDAAAWGAASNTRSELLTPFDYGVETIDDFYGATGAIRQTWQTKRGAGEKIRTVDLLTLDLEAGFFGNVKGRDDISNGWADPMRPENSRTRNYVSLDSSYRISDNTTVLYNANWDANDRKFDRNAISVAIERPPRASYIFGIRYAGDIDMNLLGGGFNYQMSEKYTLASRAWFDIESGDFGEGSIAIIRKLPRWYFALNLEYSDIDDDFSVTVSLWPEGIPEWTIGSRRFAQLGTGTGIRP